MKVNSIFFPFDIFSSSFNIFKIFSSTKEYWSFLRIFKLDDVPFVAWANYIGRATTFVFGTWEQLSVCFSSFISYLMPIQNFLTVQNKKGKTK